MDAPNKINGNADQKCFRPKGEQGVGSSERELNDLWGGAKFMSHKTINFVGPDFGDECLVEGEFIKDNKINEDNRYEEVSSSAAIMIPLTSGLLCLLLSVFLIFISIFQPYSIEMPSWGYLLLLFGLIFGFFSIYKTEKEYKFQKEHNIKWK